MRAKTKGPSAAEKAVERFEEAHSELSSFMGEHHEFVDELRRLIDDYNASIKEAGAALKNELQNSDKDKLIIGRFGARKKRKEFWDGMELAEIIPAKVSQHFLTEKLSYEVNVSKLEQLIRQGEVDRDEVYKAFHRDQPTLALMPGTPKELNL
jgi:t-SNARE complex subunit (syntaxin)